MDEGRTKAEIERLLARYGCSQFGSGWNQTPDGMHFAHVTFRHGETSIMLGLPMPHRDEFRRTPKGRRREGAALIEKSYMDERRRRWRALLLIIKAKLEAVETGISTLEREFLADVVLPNGKVLGDWAVPMLSAIQNGRLALPEHQEAR